MPDTKNYPSIEKQIELAKNPKGEDFVWNIKNEALIPVEKYIKTRASELQINLDYDVTAVEELYFNTINYTTYAGFITLHPLNLEQSLRQMSDAYADRLEQKGHIGLIARDLGNTQKLSKYTGIDPAPIEDTAEAVVVLPGGNKLKKHCCVGKLKKILDKHGRDNVLFKRHPVSYTGIFDELSDYLGGIRFETKRSNLYDIIQRSEYVYTTMISESALIAYLYGKKVDHFDLFQNRNTGSFTHINYYLFSTPDPVEWAATTFASPKSGIIHPEVDLDWKAKVDAYFQYISQLRSFYKDAYVLG